MPPHRELNERFQGHIRKAQRVRAATTAFFAGLTLLAVVGSAALAFQNIAPNAFARATSAPQHLASQLAAASVLDTIGGAIYRTLCPIFRACSAQPQQATSQPNVKPQQPSKPYSYQATTSASVKQPEFGTPAPTADGAPARDLLAGSQPAPPSNPITVIERVVDAGWNTSYVDEQVSLLRDTLLGRIAGMENANATSFRSVSSNLSAGNITGILGIANGGTGLSSAPAYGQLLLGNAASGYTLTATSSLGLPTFADVTSSVSSATFGKSWEIGSGALAPTTTLGVIVSASSTFNGGVSIDRATTTNATSTTLFATLGRFTTGIIDTLTSTAANIAALTATTITATNATTTRLDALDYVAVGRTATTTIRGDGVASTLPYASSTALTVSGTAYFPGSSIWNSSGNVGIGTAAPDVYGLGSARVLGIQSGDTSVSLQALTSGSKGFFAEATASLARFVGYQVPLYIDTQGSFDMIFRPNTSEAMRILASTGNVGIGTTGPVNKLQVVNTSAGAIASQLTLQNASNNDGTGAAIDFSGVGGDGSTATGRLASVRDGSGQYSLRFSTYGSSALEEMMRLTYDGKLGIGTISPARRLDVIDSSGNIARFGSDTTNYLDLAVGGVQTGFNSAGDRPMVFLPNGAEALRLTGSGLVGISTTTPYAKLSVTNTGTGPSFVVEDSTSPDTSPFIIDASGNVGVGTASPVRQLSVFGATPIISSFNDSGVEASLWALSGDAKVGTISNHALNIITGNATRMYFDTSGNVGIGTTNPSTKLDIRGTANTSLTVGTSGTGNSDGVTVNFEGGNVEGRWAVGANRLDIFGAAGNFGFYNNQAAAAHMVITNGGNVGIGQTSPTYKLDVTGLGRFTGLVDAANFVATSTTATTTLAGGLAVETSGLVYDYSTNRVGIGTASPSKLLDLVGSAFPTIAIGEGGSARGEIEWDQDNDRLSIQTASHAYPIRIGNDWMRFTTSGNVGIGTTNPTKTLEVNGDIKLTNYSQFLYGVSGEIIAGEDGSGVFYYGGTGGGQAKPIYFGGNNTSIQFRTSGATQAIIDSSGRLGVATTSPWRTLSVTGTVGFDGLTGSTGAGSLCLDSNKQVVYNSASDNCLSSTRATKHDIQNLDLNSLSLVDQLQPVSFVYNGSEQVRYGFIAEDTAAVDAHLATYDASGVVSGIDDRSILAVLVGALKQIASITGAFKDALIAWLGSATNGLARVHTQELCVGATCVNEDQLKSLLGQSAAAGAPDADWEKGTPSGSSALELTDADAASTNTKGDTEPAADAALGHTVPDGSSTSGEAEADTGSTTSAVDSSDVANAAGATDTLTDAATGSEPGSAEAENGQPTVAPNDDSATTATEPTKSEPEQAAGEMQAADNTVLPELDAANDNDVPEPLPSTGTE